MERQHRKMQKLQTALQHLHLAVAGGKIVHVKTALTGLQVTVNTLAGDSEEIDMEEADSVEVLIDKIRENMHFHEDDLIELFNGDALIEAGETLQAQGIKDGDELAVTVTHKGRKRLRDLGELEASYGTIPKFQWKEEASKKIKEAISCSDREMLVDYLKLIECKVPDMISLDRYPTLIFLALEKNGNGCLRVLRDFAKKSNNQELREKLEEGVVLNLVRSGKVKLLQNFVETWDDEEIQSAKDWCKMKFEETLIHAAASRGHIDVMKVLLKHPWSMSIETPTTDGTLTLECAFYGIDEGKDGRGVRLLQCMEFINLHEEARLTRQALQKILDDTKDRVAFTRKVELVQSVYQMPNMNTSVGALELLREAAEHAKETEWGLKAAFYAAMDNLLVRVTGQYPYTAKREWTVKRILPEDIQYRSFRGEFFRQYIKGCRKEVREAVDAKWQSITDYDCIQVTYVLEGDEQWRMPFIDFKQSFWVGIEGVPESYAEMFYLKDTTFARYTPPCAENVDLLEVTDNWLRVFRTDRTS